MRQKLHFVRPGAKRKKKRSKRKKKKYNRTVLKHSTREKNTGCEAHF